MKSSTALRDPSALALAAGLLLALLLSLALGGLMLQDRQRSVDEELTQNDLLARLIEEHVTRSVETAALALDAIALPLVEGRGTVNANASTFSQTLLALPQLRAIAIVDDGGRVLASSLTGETGLRIDLARLGPRPAPGRDTLGPALPGRGLADMAIGATAGAPSGVSFIPLLRSVAPPGAPPLLLVALFNPDSLTSPLSRTLNELDRHAVIATYAGALLTSTQSLAAGTDLRRLPIFAAHLPQHEHASYVGEGLRAGSQIVAFRVSSSRPLVIIVERSTSSLGAEWLSDERRRGAVGAVAVLAIVALAWLASRSLRGRELVQRDLDRAQAKVTRSERELSVIVRSVQDLLFRTDAFGVLTFVNARWAGPDGRAASAALGRPLADLVQSNERDGMRALFARSSAGGARSAEATLWTDAGGGRRFAFAVMPLRHAGRLVGFAGSASDVTERHDAKLRLREQLAFSALLLDISPLPISMFDIDGRYQEVNRAWEEFTGRTRGAVLGTYPGDALPASEARQHETVDAELRAHGGSARYEVQHRHADGSMRDLLVNKVVVPGRIGAPIGVLCVVLDMTGLRNADRVTREARDVAEEASRAKSEFIGNISHELRTPLQSIIGFSELGMVRGRMHAKLAGMFEDINTSGQRMLSLVNDLLDVSKIENAVGTFHLERTDLRPLIRDVLRELEPLLAKKRLHVESTISTVPLVAKIDPQRFLQVMRNVLANAIKFSPDANPIEVLAEFDNEKRVHIAVRDHGLGIPSPELEKIFEPFVQSSRTKDGSGGTGLGLAICRKIVSAQGGRINAENAANGGSRFHITLPTRGFADTMPPGEPID